MSRFDWTAFLSQWSQDILDTLNREERQALPPELLESRWLGHGGATEDQIARLESRLGIPLPPSYRAFLTVTNGWRQTTPFIHRLWSTDEIERFIVRHKAWADQVLSRYSESDLNEEQGDRLTPSGCEWPSVSDDEYFVYGYEQDCRRLRAEYLNTAIEISDVGESSIYLLNPEVITPDGEWEAWFFSDLLPGADRYPSFQAMMEAEYQNFLELRDTPEELLEKISLPSLQPTAAVTPSVKDALPQDALLQDALLQDALPEGWTDGDPDGDRSPLSPAIAPSEGSAPCAGPPPSCPCGAPSPAPVAIASGSRSREPIPDWRQTEMQPSPLPSLDSPPASQHLPGVKPMLVFDQIFFLQPPFASQTLQGSVGHADSPGLLQGHEPFALEALFSISAAEATEADLQCRVQFYACDRTTGLLSPLGTVPLRPLRTDPTCYKAHLPHSVLAPGLYQLRILTTTPAGHLAPGYFEVPLLQVV